MYCKVWPLITAAALALGFAHACDTDESDHVGTTTSTSSSSSAGSFGGYGGGGGCSDPGGCHHCGAIFLEPETYGPDGLCCESEALFDALFACMCEVCSSDCTVGPCDGSGPPDGMCWACVEASCSSAREACIADCPTGTPGCGAGGSGGVGGAGGA